MVHGSPLEVFRVFLKLGLTSFGGPIAHLGNDVFLAGYGAAQAVPGPLNSPTWNATARPYVASGRATMPCASWRGSGHLR